MLGTRSSASDQRYAPVAEMADQAWQLCRDRYVSGVKMVSWDRLGLGRLSLRLLRALQTHVSLNLGLVEPRSVREWWQGQSRWCAPSLPCTSGDLCGLEPSKTLPASPANPEFSWHRRRATIGGAAGPAPKYPLAAVSPHTLDRPRTSFEFSDRLAQRRSQRLGKTARHPDRFVMKPSLELLGLAIEGVVADRCGAFQLEGPTRMDVVGMVMSRGPNRIVPFL